MWQIELFLNALYKAIKDKEDATAVVTVITDGLENASKEYSVNAIKALAERMKNEEGWNFAYIGTNQDVEATSASLSIDNHMTFRDDEVGMRKAWSTERKSRTMMYSRMAMENKVSSGLASSARKLFRSRSNQENRNYHETSEFSDRVTPAKINNLHKNEIFVFGSNLAGMHTGRAARLALQRLGAILGQGVGLQGQSYAIPTMQGDVDTMMPYVEEFINFAKQHQEYTFFVTQISCGIAGFTPAEIAPLFANAVYVENIHLPQQFWEELI